MSFPSGPLTLVHPGERTSTVPYLSWSQVRQRQVAVTRGLYVAFRPVRVSAVLRPNMNDEAAKFVPPYEVAVIGERNDDFLVQVGMWTREDAQECHDGLVAALRAAHRHRTRRTHTDYHRRRRCRYGRR